MPIARAGTVLAQSAGGAGMASTLIGGALCDWVGRHDPRRNLYLIAAICAAGTPVGVAAVMVGSTTLSLLLLPLFLLLGGSYTPVTAMLISSLAATRNPGTVMATMSLLVSAIGGGLGPFLVGVISHHVGGADPLGYALASILVSYVGAVACFLLAARTIRADLVRAATYTGTHTSSASFNPRRASAQPDAEATF